MYELYPQTKVKDGNEIQLSGVNGANINISEAKRLCYALDECVGFVYDENNVYHFYSNVNDTEYDDSSSVFYEKKSGYDFTLLLGVLFVSLLVIVYWLRTRQYY